MSPVRRKPSVKPYQGRAATTEEPLEFIRANTYSQRQVGVTLERFDQGEAQADEIIAACEFLSVELPLHIFDVSDDLVPLLRSRCKPSDNIEPVLQELEAAQRAAKSLGGKSSRGMMSQIERMPGRKPTEAMRRQARDLLAALRRLSAIENGIVLPLARVRLDIDDLATLSAHIRSRRGILKEGDSNE